MTDCIIIGGGIIGMMVARCAALAGYQVMLFDKGRCGQECSWASSGVLSPLYPWRYNDTVNKLSWLSQTIYPKLCRMLYQRTHIDPQYRRCGLLMLDEYHSEHAQHWLALHDIQYQPRESGAFFANIAQVRNPRLLRALKKDLITRGVQLHEHTTVEKILSKGRIAQGIVANNKKTYARHLVVCAGAWSSELIDNDDIYPVKGQMILLKSLPNLVKHIILCDNKYLVPRKDGLILVGSTYEDVGFDKATNQQTMQALLNFAHRCYPVLLSADIVHHWAGLRPASHRNSITIARHRKYQRLYFNIGHFTNGLNTAPASAEKLVNIITKYDA